MRARFKLLASLFFALTLAVVTFAAPTEPLSDASCPESCEINVVLPAPLGPMMACVSPGRTSRCTSSVAVTPPTRFCRP